MARRRAGRERWRGTERGESGGKAQSGGRALDCIKRAGRRAPKLARARPLFPRARSFPDAPAISTLFSTVIFILYLIFISTLFSTVIFILYLIFISTSLLSTLFFYFFFLLKNRVGDDGVPAILQYRSSDLYPTDRKETMAILKKDTHTPLQICKQGLPSFILFSYKINYSYKCILMFLATHGHLARSKKLSIICHTTGCR